MIAIDFQGGAHGNFLEVICNVAAGVQINADPFNDLGASHNKQYLNPQVFTANHYSYWAVPLPGNRVISVDIAIDDLLPLSQISLLRAGDYNFDNDKLEINTYNKLNNEHYRWVLDSIIHAFFVNQVSDSYNAVKDISWPDVKTINDFAQLPEHIRRECIEIHNLKLLELDETHPDCPRDVLREFFQIGFEHPENAGFVSIQQRQQYNSKVDVYNFPFASFYKHEEFLDQISSIAEWAGLTYNTQDQINLLHQKFLEKQPYKDSKIRCDQLVHDLAHNNISPPNITLLEEAYVNAMLKRFNSACRY